MLKTTIHYIEAIAGVAAVAAPVHYVAGLDWPWAVFLGAAVVVVLRALSHLRSAPPINP